MRHKHADLIHAWAEGAEIQVKDGDHWITPTTTNPMWHPYNEYRIKPEKKPDVVKYMKIEAHPLAGIRFVESDLTPGQLRCTFDGETGKLIKAEVL